VSEITFDVHGLPIAQGSKNQFGGESNAKALRPWRNDIAVAAFDKMSGYPPWSGPVALRAVFVFPRPKTHYRTGKHAGEVKDNAPGWKPSAPDLDKLVRALGDAITGVVIRDDAQIVDIRAIKKWGETPGVTVHLHEV
jgi:Holliday junction resolvase RusA-like endonuclease